jgi:hypothetical protein
MFEARVLAGRRSVFAVAALTGALVLTGCASAATKTSAPRSTTHKAASRAGNPAGPQASKASGPVQFTAYSGTDGAKSVVVITGAIGDFGQAVRTYANGKIEKQYNQLNFVVTHGSFRVSIVSLESQLVSAFNHFPSNTMTCSGIVTATGTTPIVAGSGTGVYKGISGTFTTSITIHEVDSWPRCKALLAQTIFTTGSGNVSFG